MSWDQMLKYRQISLPMIHSRFPDADETALEALQRGSRHFAELMARTHDLTSEEAREVVEDWLHILHMSSGNNSDVA